MMNIKDILFNTILMVVSVIISFVAAESGYRYYLYLSNPEKFNYALNRGLPTFGLYNFSHWEFDKELGYVYPPNREIHQTFISAGVVRGCTSFNTINERGNIGPIRGDYASADVKIAVFGDSFPAFIVDGMTFPAKLQETLSERLNKSVHVVNFGRDGTGVLQVFDTAVAKLPEWKPDLAIITFTTDDLDRVRIWRTVTSVNGEKRVLTTIDPEPNPSIDRSQDTFVIEERATPEWCQSVLGKEDAHLKDALLQDLFYRYRRMAREAGYWFPDPWSLEHSFLYNRLVHGDPFYSSDREQFTIPRVPFEDYAQDEQFVQKLDALEKMGIPYVIVHLPVSPEVAMGKEADLFPKRAALWNSLESVTGKKILGVTDYIPMPLEKPSRMDASPDNLHPGPFGMKIYADAITKMVIDNNLIK
ncbi:SGNH/GDSL hydrolase family protein [Magnetovibrio sp.]|uniref:SGNH/GDSL hydrolase family protein n=1 Tax=Magnetovibrio sp. TaxID=2024836 RepID=UPI002F9527A4